MHKNSVYKLTPQAVYGYFEVTDAGLTNEVVLNRQQQYGKNVLKTIKMESMWSKFSHHFTSLRAVLLWIGGFVAFIAKMPQLGIAIWIVNIINGVFGFWQEFQAGKVTDALTKMLPSYARVIRNNTEIQILTEELVVGDILIISEGDKFLLMRVWLNVVI